MNGWKDYVAEVKENGFDKASPIARLIWSCEVGQINQHASLDLMEIAEELAVMRAAVEAAKAALKNINPTAVSGDAWRQIKKATTYLTHKGNER